MRKHPKDVGTMARGGAWRRPEPKPAPARPRWLGMGLVAFALAACSAGTGSRSVVTTDFQFDPTVLTVTVGAQVEYRNQDKAEHTVSQGRDGQLDADAAFDEKLPRDSAITITFATAGTFGVTCTIHPTMNQVVTVTP